MKPAARRYTRTLVLSLAALGALIWVAVDQFGIATEEILDLFLATVMVTGVVIGAAALFTAVWLGLKWLLKRIQGNAD